MRKLGAPGGGGLVRFAVTLAVMFAATAAVAMSRE